MPVITLPDGSRRTYPAALTVADVAADIGPGLAKAALAGRIAGQLVDTSLRIEQDVELAIITERDADGLEVIRHSTAHLLAMAVQSLFPTAQVTIGPVIDDGFFYDFAFERPFTLDDLAKIEQKMTELAAGDLPISRVVVSRDEAIRMFDALGESYKVQIIRELPDGDEISIYKQGEWMDLCRGPHVPSTAKLKAFKLTKVSGAYWRGDSQNEVLQRIYGTAWPDQKQLKAYLMRIEEAEKRDHRKIGKRLDLFHLQEEAPGMVFWHPRGWAIYTVIEAYMRQLQRKHGYKEIRTPLVMDRVLWEKSGHWQNYAENMFTTASESRDYAVKPMNCPGHVQVFNQGLKSYRDLPLRLAEFGCCHRNEPSGSLHGIMRIRGFTQDDAHIFCTDDDVQAEAAAFIALTQQVYADFGFTDVQMKLSTRPAKRVGADELWDKAEYALESALRAAGLEYELQPGEGAFYGPKIEFSLKDCIGRVWQCGTLQLDFNLPERLGASYVTEDNNRKPVAMLHRAVLGSFERFIGILIENYEGAFPVWLSPVQAVVMNITDQQAGYVSKVEDFLQNQGFRVESDLRNEKIGFKIREHTIQRIPYLLVVGDREAQTNTVAVRARGGEELGSMTLEALATFLTTEIAKHGRIFSQEGK